MDGRRLFLFSYSEGLLGPSEIWKLWYTYTERMKKLEADLPDAKGKTSE